MVRAGGRGFAASLAQRADLDRATQQHELAKRRTVLEHSVELRRFQVTHAVASDAHHVMMSIGVTVVTRGIVEHRHLASFARVAQRLECAMHRGQRDHRLLGAHLGKDFLGRGMVARSEQRFENRDPLRRDCEALLATACYEIRHSARSIALAPLLAHQLKAGFVRTRGL